MYLASLMKQWVLFVFFYAVCFPIGVGLCYWTPILCGYEWYPKRKGMVSGIIIGAFGFGAFIFGFITTHIVNPNNEKPVGDSDDSKYYNNDVAENVPRMFYICVVIWAVLMLIGSALVSRSPEYVR